MSGKHFGCSISARLKKFYKCANAIFRIEGKSDEMTMLRLIESHCTPILTYGIEIIRIADVSSRNKLRVAYNSIFRRIFGYRYFESVRELQGSLERPTWEALVDKRKQNFKRQLSHCSASSLVHLFSMA